jgi:hypothetical protein
LAKAEIQRINQPRIGPFDKLRDRVLKLSFIGIKTKSVFTLDRRILICWLWPIKTIVLPPAD